VKIQIIGGEFPVNWDEEITIRDIIEERDASIGVGLPEYVNLNGRDRLEQMFQPPLDWMRYRLSSVC
jgi:hypothetical protein